MSAFYADIVSATVFSTTDSVFCLSCGPVMIWTALQPSMYKLTESS